MEQANQKAKSGFDFHKFLHLCLKSWWIYAGCIVCFLGLAITYAVVRQPKFDIESKLKLPPEASMGGLSIDMGVSFNISDFIGGSSSTDNEVATFMSHNVFLNTTKQLDLNAAYFEKKYFFKWNAVYNRTPIKISTLPEVPDTMGMPLVFEISPKGGVNADIVLKVKKKKVAEAKGISLPYTFDTPYGPFSFDTTKYYSKTEAYRFKVIYSSYAAAAESYARTVRIFAPDKKTDFITLSYITPDPKFGENLLSTIIDNYNSIGQDYSDDLTKARLELVNNRLATLKEEIAVTESEMETFKKSNKIVNPEYDSQQTLEKWARIDMAMIQTQTENTILRNARNFIMNPDNKYSLIPDLPAMSAGALSGDKYDTRSASSAVSGAIKELNAYNMLVLERMKLLTSMKESNSQVKLLDAQLDALRSNVIASADRAIENSDIELKEINKQNNLIQTRINSMPTLEKEYIGIQRMMVVQEQLYLFLLKQREEAMMSLAKEGQKIMVIDAPHKLTLPAGLDNSMLIIIAFLLAVLFPTVWVYLVSYAKAPMYSGKEIGSAANAPMIGSFDADEESMRRLRNEVTHILSLINGKVVAVTSMEPSAGKTMLAVDLARSMAAADKRTLIVDASLRKPDVAAMLGISEAAGLSEALSSSAATPQIQNAGNNLYALTAGSKLQNAGDIIANGRIGQLIDAFAKEYDYIVIDTASMQECSDMLSMAQVPDLTLCVTRLRQTSSAEIDALNKLFDSQRLTRLAIVVNENHA